MMARKLVRPRRGAWVAGVAHGMADYTGIPVGLVRFLWLLALLPGGVPGVLLYVICWVLIPKQEW